MHKRNSLKDLFSNLYKAESNAVFRFCLLRVSDFERAMDLTQETFARVWRSISKGARLENERAFIFTVARHLIIDWYRKKKDISLEMFTTTTDDKNEGLELNVKLDDRDEELAAEGRYLLGLIDKLGPSYREAVHLRYVEGLPPSDIAKILNITENAASVRVNRGLAELKRLSGYSVSTHEDPKMS